MKSVVKCRRNIIPLDGGRKDSFLLFYAIYSHDTGVFIKITTLVQKVARLTKRLQRVTRDRPPSTYNLLYTSPSAHSSVLVKRSPDGRKFFLFIQNLTTIKTDFVYSGILHQDIFSKIIKIIEILKGHP